MKLRAALQRGCCIPAHPLALDGSRRLDERAQRALSRYYLDAGAGGLALGVHTTQFAVRDHGLLAPVLALAAEEARARPTPPLLIAGVCGDTPQALREASLAREAGYDLVLLSFTDLRAASEERLLEHASAVGEVLPLFGFYLQEAVGGRFLSRRFWARFAELEALAAIKVAPFDRARTLDVLHGVAASGRADEVALYTGNDDAIVHDLTTTFEVGGRRLRFAGGLLGHWAVWTRCAVALQARAREEALDDLARPVTDMNAALFDAAHGFRGCIAGVQHVLCGQGLLSSELTLDPEQGLSPGQAAQIARVRAAYPHLIDDEFVAEHRDRWLA